MSVDDATVVRIARLARIGVQAEEIPTIAKNLNGILAWVEQLKEVDTEGVPPMTSVVEARLRMRPDVVNDGGQAEKILANAPEAVDGFFAVPKVLE
jgi:aspartyl-tRNA(Asn)/glutamyl-tRNA(Gln) amidotransferase subunit C